MNGQEKTISPTLTAQLCEINEREKAQNRAFYIWIYNDKELQKLSIDTKSNLIDYVRGLNMYISELKSKIARESA